MKPEPLATIELECNGRQYTVKVYNRENSFYPWIGTIYDDTNKCIGTTKQLSIGDIRESAISLVLHEF